MSAEGLPMTGYLPTAQQNFAAMKKAYAAGDVAKTSSLLATLKVRPGPRASTSDLARSSRRRQIRRNPPPPPPPPPPGLGGGGGVKCSHSLGIEAESPARGVSFLPPHYQG